jgi:hypothetical protein
MRFIFLFCFPIFLFAQVNTQFAVVKYNGGGDWYANPTSLTNLISFCNEELNMQIDPKYATVEIGSEDIFNYPFVHLTGHGNVVLNAQEEENIARYLKSGGFLHVDDNYGMDKFIRPVLEQLLPNTTLEELGTDHKIFKSQFVMSNGLPKIHEHDAAKPQAFALYYQGRMVLLYTFESDLGDGWEDANVHNDSEEIRTKALRMGANIVTYVLTGQ